MKKLLILTAALALMAGDAWAQKKEELLETINKLTANETVLSAKIDSLSKVCVANQQIIEQMNSIIEMYKTQAEATTKLLSNMEQLMEKLDQKAGCDYEIKGLISSGLALVSKGTLFGYVDREGKWVIDAQFDYANDFSPSGYALVKMNDAWGVIDTSGKICIPCEYEQIKLFRDTIYIVFKDGLYGLQSVDGTLVQPIKYSEIYRIGEADTRAKVCCDGLYGYVDQNGKLVIPTKYIYALNFEKTGVASVQTKEGERITIDVNGNRVDR